MNLPEKITALFGSLLLVVMIMAFPHAPAFDVALVAFAVGCDVGFCYAAARHRDELENVKWLAGDGERKETALVEGREAILRVHAKRIPLAEDVNIPALASGTVGFSEADLARLVREAARLARRQNRTSVFMADFEASKGKVLSIKKLRASAWFIVTVFVIMGFVAWFLQRGGKSDPLVTWGLMTVTAVVLGVLFLEGYLADRRLRKQVHAEPAKAAKG